MSAMPRLIRPSALRVRAPRVPVLLQVESKTIGTSAAYCLSTEDVSRSGLLLTWDRHAIMPFNINTLLEMTIDPMSACLVRPVECLGKVVRREMIADDGLSLGTRLGVQIVQIDQTDLYTWEGCLLELEKRLGIDVNSKARIDAV